MTSKWIKNIEDCFYNAHPFDSVSYYRMYDTFGKIDKLLRLAAYSTDNEDLHEAILEQLEEVKDVVVT